MLPLNNIWDSETPKWFFISYFLILLIETLLFKAYFRQIKLGTHLKTIILTNILSSLVGSLVINFFVDEKIYLDDSYPKIFAVFFIITVLTEYPVLKYCYSKYALKKLFFKTVIANLLTYVLLFVLQLSGFLMALKWVEIKADRYKSEWTHKEIVPETLKVIYAKNVNRGMDSEIVIFDSGFSKTLKHLSGKNVQAVAKDYILLSKKKIEAKGELLNWKSKTRVYDEVNIYQSKIFHSEDIGLILFRKRSGLEGIVDSSGWRKMYGYSYEADSLSGSLGESLKNLRYGGIFRFGDDLIYSTHDDCMADQAESSKGNKVERCSKDPSTHIVRRRADGSLISLARDSRRPLLIRTNLYFLNDKQQIEKLDLARNVKDIVLEDLITDFKISKDEKYFVIKTENMFPLGQRYFLVIVERSTNKRFIIDDGQIIDFDILD